VSTPGPVATQVNERPGSSSVTTYSVPGMRGWLIFARLPDVLVAVPPCP
jgi:hypothetical protein